MPALITGTSSEFLGRRALPRILRQRPLCVVLGPSGSGKSSVAGRLAGPRHVSLDTKAVEDALVECIAEKRWSGPLPTVDSLVLDCPVWLRNRPAAGAALRDLLRTRIEKGGRTVLVQGEDDDSIDLLLAEMPAGSMVVLGLRFPKGKRGKLRFARRVCDQLQLPRLAARGTDQLEPWNYERVILYLVSWRPESEGDK